MRLYALRSRTICPTILALAGTLLLSDTAAALDWRVIQDQIGVQVRQGEHWPYPSTPMYHSFQIEAPQDWEKSEAKVLFEQGFEGDALGAYPGHPGVTLIKDPDGTGICARFSVSEFRLKSPIPIQPGHFILLRWKARVVAEDQSGDRSKGAYIETEYRDAQGKTVGKPMRHRACAGQPDGGWQQQIWTHAPSWPAAETQFPADTASIAVRFFHDSSEKMVTLVDDIQLIDVQPLALKIIVDTIAVHRQLLSTAVQSIRLLPATPEAKGWKQVLTVHGDRVASQLDRLAQQNATSEEFIRDSDPPLLFARRLADAAEALKNGVAHPATILTYRTRPIPALGPFYGHVRRDPVGVLPYALEIEGEPANRVTVQACRGEFEPISISLWSPENVDQVSVHTSALEGSAGRIPATNLDVKLVKWWYQKSYRWWLQSALVPRFLVNDDTLIKTDHQQRRNYVKLSFPDSIRYAAPPSYPQGAIEEEMEAFPIRDGDTLRPFDLVGGQNKQIWITVKVPDEAEPGRYAGDFILKADDGEIARVELGVEVLPFSLPSPKTHYDLSQDYTAGFYYRGRLDPAGKGKVGYAAKNEDQLRAELKLMFDHGIVAPVLLPPGWGQPEALFRRELQMMRDIGMSERPLYLGRNIGFPKQEQDLARLKDHVRKTISLAREYGFTDVYFYGRDEAGGELLKSQIPAFRAVRKAGGKTYVSLTHQWRDKAPDVLDQVIAAGWPSRELAAARHRLGHKVSAYWLWTKNHDPLMFRRNHGLYLWSHNYDGFTPYCFMHNHGGVWNHFDGTDEDFNIAYPTVNGVIGTLPMEALREGIDDVRYATLLMQRIEQTRQHGMVEAKVVADAAFEWIESVPFLVADQDTVRDKMIGYIMKLSQE